MSYRIISSLKSEMEPILARSPTKHILKLLPTRERRGGQLSCGTAPYVKSPRLDGRRIKWSTTWCCVGAHARTRWGARTCGSHNWDSRAGRRPTCTAAGGGRAGGRAAPQRPCDRPLFRPSCQSCPGLVPGESVGPSSRGLDRGHAPGSAGHARGQKERPGSMSRGRRGRGRAVGVGASSSRVV